MPPSRPPDDPTPKPDERRPVLQCFNCGRREPTLCVHGVGHDYCLPCAREVYRQLGFRPAGERPGDNHTQGAARVGVGGHPPESGRAGSCALLQGRGLAARHQLPRGRPAGVRQHPVGLDQSRVASAAGSTRRTASAGGRRGPSRRSPQPDLALTSSALGAFNFRIRPETVIDTVTCEGARGGGRQGTEEMASGE